MTVRQCVLLPRPMPYCSALGGTVLVAVVVAFAGATVTSESLQRSGPICGGCSGFWFYLLPTMFAAAVAAVLALAIGVFLIARRSGPTVRAALAVDVARVAAIPMVVFGGFLLCTGVTFPDPGAFGYGAALSAGGLVPVAAARGGKRWFLSTSLGSALLAIAVPLVLWAVAVPAVMLAPLLAAYGAALVLAAAVASRSPSGSRPHG